MRINSTTPTSAFTHVATFTVALILSLGILCPGAPAASDAHKKLKDRLAIDSEIELHLGVNDVVFHALEFGPKYEPYEHPPLRVQHGEIVVAADDNGSHVRGSYYFITTQGSDESYGSWDATSAFGPKDRNNEGIVLRDESHQGAEKYVSVRFFNGSLDGKSTTLLFITKLDVEHIRPSNGSAKARIMLFAFYASDHPRGLFMFIDDLRPRQRYCDADAALWFELTVPVPSGSGAPATCPSD